MKRELVCLLAALTLDSPAPAQSTAFEVVSIKPAPQNKKELQQHLGTQLDPAMVDFGGVSLLMLLTRAYGLHSFQVLGPCTKQPDTSEQRHRNGDFQKGPCVLESTIHFGSSPDTKSDATIGDRSRRKQQKQGGCHGRVNVNGPRRPTANYSGAESTTNHRDQRGSNPVWMEER